MSRSSHHGGGSGASVDYHLWTTGVPQTQRIMPAPNRQPMLPKTWEALPQARFDEYILKGTSISHTLRSQDDWHFGEVGQGAFSFQVKNAGGNLVIALTAWNHSDMNGYYIVLDDDKHESYVLKVAKLGNNGLLANILGGGFVGSTRQYARVKNVFADKSFRLVHDKIQTFWVMYQHGTIVVGEGPTPGVGRRILYMEPEPGKPRTHGMDLYHYGFARHGSRWPGDITVFNTQTFSYRHGPFFTLPENSLKLTETNATAPVLNKVVPLVEGNANGNDGGVLYRGNAANLQ